MSRDSLRTRSELATDAGPAILYRLDRLAEEGIADIDALPFSIRVLLESLLRNEDGEVIRREDLIALAQYDPSSPPDIEIPFKPSRVLLQDFTGVPCLVDLAAMRSAMNRLGGDPARVNPDIPVDLVIDHSVQVDAFGSPDALAENARLEFERNRERYEFLHWGQRAFDGLRVVPPASGICHQVNLEYLAPVVQRRPDLSPRISDPITSLTAPLVLLPDSLVGTDSHTTMINGLGVLGWGVGGIEAEAAILGQPLYMLAPPVVGVRLTGHLAEGATATDLVLTLTEKLRRHGVVGKFVEYFGPGLDSMTVPDRATIANMAPEYGATVGFFPVDVKTLDYLLGTGRSKAHVKLVETYCRTQRLFRTSETPAPKFQDVIDLDLGTVRGCVAGPNRPQDRVPLSEMKPAWSRALRASPEERGFGLLAEDLTKRAFAGKDDIGHGAVVIAAITSCTNTSNPTVLLTAGLLAKRAVESGLRVPSWVKTSLAPGSRVVTSYLQKADLLPYLERLGFHVVGYGCTTCIGNSGPLPDTVARAVVEEELVVASVLSGNRNFDGRINPQVRAAYLASPPLVVAYALAGTVDIDLCTEPLGIGTEGESVYLRDVWPRDEEVARILREVMTPAMFAREYAGIEASNPEWNQIPASGEAVYDWREGSTYIQEPPFFQTITREAPGVKPIEKARVLVLAGDSVTTDHISPAGAIPADSAAGRYLVARGVTPLEFNSFGSRRGNDRVMTRGTFANIRFRNLLVPGTEGGRTVHFPSGEETDIYDAAQRYQAEGVETIVLAGRDYGMGSSRDWAAKGALLLGVRAVIARSFERIHRSNLVGMGVLPLQFRDGEGAAELGLTGTETYTISNLEEVEARAEISVSATDPGGATKSFTVLCRLDTAIEVGYYRNGGILHTILRRWLWDS